MLRDKDREFFPEGRFGLHRKGEIVEIELWMEQDTGPKRELHFRVWTCGFRRKSRWGYYEDFEGFSNNRKELRKLRRSIKRGKKTKV